MHGKLVVSCKNALSSRRVIGLVGAMLLAQHGFFICKLATISVRDVVADEEETLVVDAMRHWEEHTCIRFHQRTNQFTYINFFQGSG